MGASLRNKVSPGDPVGFSAGLHNMLVDAARGYQASQLGRFGGIASERFLEPAVLASVWNTTGTHLPAGAVLTSGSAIGLTERPLDIADHPLVTGAVPSGSGDSVLVLRKATPNGTVGTAMGMAVCVVIGDGAYAAPIPGRTDAIQAGASGGPVRVLDRGAEAPGGGRVALVLLQSWATPTGGYYPGGGAGGGGCNTRITIPRDVVSCHPYGGLTKVTYLYSFGGCGPVVVSQVPTGPGTGDEPALPSPCGG